MFEIKHNKNINSKELGMFFIENVDETYISFGDIYFCGRARGDLKWVPNLEEVIVCEINDIISGKIPNKEVITAYKDEILAGFAIIGFDNSIATLEDIVIKNSLRQKGIGKAFYKKIESSLKTKGIEVIQLESSPSNKKAHKFFYSEGFQSSSIIMTKILKEKELK